MYFVVLVLIPPFQTNDEDAHWMRLWTVASGHLTCKQIPRSVGNFIGAAQYWEVRTRKVPYRFANVDAELAVRGGPEQMSPGGATCLYLPVSYLGPALIARVLGHATDAAASGRMFLAFYAARTFNLILCALGVWLCLRAAPWLRTLTLVLFSLPMLMQQAISINQDSTILLLGLVLLALWWRKPSFRASAGMLAVIGVLSLTKPVYLVLLLFALASFQRVRRVEPERARWHYAAVSLLALAPIAVWMWWTGSVLADKMQQKYLPSWVDMPGQLAYLKAHPLMVPKVIVLQLRDLFGRGHLTGGWVSVIGVLGWADFEIGDRAYFAFLAAVPLACAADYVREAQLPAAVDVAGRWWDHALPFASFFAIIPAIAVAMYVQFSGVGSEYALGTSGRYLHLPYFAMIALGMTWVRARWSLRDSPRRAALANGLILASMALCAVGVWDALKAIALHYYSIG